MLAQPSDYVLVRQALELISTDWQAQPGLDEMAGELGVTPVQLTRTFQRWCGLTPKGFLQAVTLDHARRMLNDGLPLLDAGRLHDLFVSHEAMSPGEWKAKGAGLAMTYGFHDSPFGRALITATTRGMTGIGFSDPDLGGDDAALADMQRRWPEARLARDDAATAPHAAQAFDPSAWSPDRPLRVVLIGTDFEVRVWEGLLGIPFGRMTTYSALAARIGRAEAPRAVGAAVGRNPLSFVVPCHRVIGKSGALTGYHWGLTRKRAILGWEAAQAGLV
jgi:AraC family transcriptional regulator of adaptative response/methylated-DNA-[protein]-cysteine methyltransferase